MSDEAGGEAKRSESEGSGVALTAASSERVRVVFLRTLAETGSDRQALEAARMRRADLRRLMAEDSGFAEDVQDAREEYADRLEEAAHARAVSGWDEEVYQLGQKVGTVKRFDGRLLEKLLEGARPAKYRSGFAGGGPVVVMVDRRGERLSAEAWSEAYPAKVNSIGEGSGEGDRGLSGREGAVERCVTPPHPDPLA